MPEENVNERGPAEAGEAEARPREALDAAADAVGERMNATIAKVRKDEAHARTMDALFVELFRGAVQRLDAELLGIVVRLLERDVPTVIILSGLSLLDDSMLAKLQPALPVAPETARALARTVETDLAPFREPIEGLPRVRSWLLVNLLALHHLDDDQRARTLPENRDAEEIVAELLQGVLLRFVGSTTVPMREDAARILGGYMDVWRAQRRA